jgi:hypothetical protein
VRKILRARSRSAIELASTSIACQFANRPFSEPVMASARTRGRYFAGDDIRAQSRHHLLDGEPQTLCESFKPSVDEKGPEFGQELVKSIHETLTFDCLTIQPSTVKDS